MKNYILLQYFIQNILNRANYYNEMINVKLGNDKIINIDANMLIKCVSSYFNLVGSYEYKNISPCLNFDIYDISYYKRVLNLLKKKLKNFGK